MNPFSPTPLFKDRRENCRGDNYGTNGAKGGWEQEEEFVWTLPPGIIA